jgi:hypothetical protein
MAERTSAASRISVLSTIVLLGSRRRLWVPAAIVGVVWLVTFAHRVVSL